MGDKFAELVNTDFNLLKSQYALVCEEKLKNLLFVRTVQGRMENGHGTFRKNKGKFPDKTLTDTTIALGRDPEKDKRDTQNYIQMIKNLLLNVIDGRPVSKLAVGGIELLERYDNLKNVGMGLTGAYRAARMDSEDARKRANDIYGSGLGRGVCMAINLKNAKKYNLTLEKLAREEHDLNCLIKNGVAINREVQTSRNIVCGYIRLEKGKPHKSAYGWGFRGTSDDAAMFCSGLIDQKKNAGVESVIWTYLMDLVDTLDKYTPKIIPGGCDEALGRLIKDNEDLIQSNYPGFELPTEDKIAAFIHAIREEEKIDSNSQRYMLQLSHRTDYSGSSCPLEAPLDYISPNGKGLYKNIRIFQNKKFYNTNTLYNQILIPRMKKLGLI